MDFDECVRKGFLKIVSIEKGEIQKELKDAADDLKISGYSLSSDEYKWSIIQSYYCMFHAARALLYS